MGITVETQGDGPQLENDRCPQRGSWRKVTPVFWNADTVSYMPNTGVAERWINLDHMHSINLRKAGGYTSISLQGEGEISVAELPWQIIGGGERGRSNW